MKNRRRQLLVFSITALAILLISPFSPARAGESLELDDFTTGIPDSWQEKSFKGSTSYSPAVIDSVPCLQARAEHSASGLFHKVDFDPGEYPILSWQWRVEDIISQGDAGTKAGDDYAARIYVVFPSIFFWKTKALNYVWANKLPEGTAVPNSFTANAMMISVKSGPNQAGTWQRERRNIYEDFQKYFGSPPPRVGAIAIMTDTDNTGENASACYGPISISKSP